MQKVIIWRYPHHTLTNLDCKPESRDGKLSFDRSIGYFCGSIRHFCGSIRHFDYFILHPRCFIRHFCCAIRHFRDSIRHFDYFIHRFRFYPSPSMLSPPASQKKSTLPIGSVVLSHIYFTARMKMRSLSYSGASSVKSDVTSRSLKPMS